MRDGSIFIMSRGTTHDHQTTCKAKANINVRVFWRSAYELIVGAVCGARTYVWSQTSRRLTLKRVMPLL